MSKLKVLLSCKWPDSVEAALQETYEVTLNARDKSMSHDDFRTALQQYDVILPTVTDVLDAAVFNGIEARTKFIGNFGVGYTHIDTDTAKSADITVSNTPDVLSDCSGWIGCL
jgi:glyoxylate reductase